MPGLINGHNHSAMVLFRGMADDMKLMEWLNDYVFPMEARFVNPEFIKTGTRLACWEMIRGGTTTFVDMYFYPDVIANVIEQCGLRAVISAPSIDYPSPGFGGWNDSFKAAVDYVSRWKNKNERITPAFGPHAPYTVSPDHIRQVARKALELDVPVSMHIAEAPSELLDIRTRYQNTPVNHVAEQGLLDVRLIAAHMVHPTVEEITMLANKKTGVIHNPTSNLKLAAGVSPVAKMLEAGVLVGLGTDGAASNNDLDMWEEIHLTALIHKNQSKDPTAMPALTALTMATSMGAAAIGLGDQTGILKAGLRADMIQIDISDPRLTPMYNVISQLVYAVDSHDVVTTIVSGRILMEDARVLTLDAGEVRAAAIARTREIARKLTPVSVD
jgi:5-methylthioadenosine/S-adenosylhomocysteine deaminase